MRSLALDFEEQSEEVEELQTTWVAMCPSQWKGASCRKRKERMQLSRLVEALVGAPPRVEPLQGERRDDCFLRGLGQDCQL